jgi:glutamate formiminotransferase/formiminotetrahydrofolate cyclodeaminase
MIRSGELDSIPFLKRAVELIDMSRHQGAHPRIGSMDVCPFVPELLIMIVLVSQKKDKLVDTMFHFVPAAVPSLFHSSGPLTPSVA